MSAGAQPLPRWADLVLLPVVNLLVALLAAGAMVALVGQDPLEVIARRLANAREELSHVHDFDYVIINSEFKTAAAELRVHADPGEAAGVGGEAAQGARTSIASRKRASRSTARIASRRSARPRARA